MENEMGNCLLTQEKIEPHHYLPSGFRFHPTDEELMEYLKKKITCPLLSVPAILELDMNQWEPWDIPGRCKRGEKELYFFTLRDKKYPRGIRTNRATQAGYWKGTGKDREIYSSYSSNLLGMKKTLVFYKGRAPKGQKTNWIIHEYKQEGGSCANFLPLQHTNTPKDTEWVVCRIFYRLSGGRKAVLSNILNTSFINTHNSHKYAPALNECRTSSLLARDDLVCQFTPSMHIDMSSVAVNDTHLLNLPGRAGGAVGCWTGHVSSEHLALMASSPSEDVEATILEPLPSSSLSDTSNAEIHGVNLHALHGRPAIWNSTRRSRKDNPSQNKSVTRTSMISSNSEPDQHPTNLTSGKSICIGGSTKQCICLAGNESYQRGNQVPDRRDWVEEEANFDYSQATYLHPSPSLDSSLFEISQTSPILYATTICSSEFLEDCLWKFY